MEQRLLYSAGRFLDWQDEACPGYIEFVIAAVSDRVKPGWWHLGDSIQAG